MSEFADFAAFIQKTMPYKTTTLVGLPVRDVLTVLK